MGRIVTVPDGAGRSVTVSNWGVAQTSRHLLDVDKEVGLKNCVGVSGCGVSSRSLQKLLLTAELGNQGKAPTYPHCLLVYYFVLYYKEIQGLDLGLKNSVAGDGRRILNSVWQKSRDFLKTHD
jgi:hypothetical protein